jgi:glycosyltransferase involved in cell wall biosynthesis
MSRPVHERLRVDLVSEHASPLAALGGPDAGGQNVYVAELAGHLAALGHDVVVHTRRDDPHLPERVRAERGFTVCHVPAGPARPVPKDDLAAYMPAFGDHLARAWAERRPHVAHAHFWMSGTAALRGARALGTPVLQTYHALGTVKARHQGAADTSPPQRVSVEGEIGRRCHRVLATCADEVAELAAMGVTADRVSVVPCGVDPAHFAPVPDASPAGHRPPRVLAVGRLVPRKGFDRAIRLLARVPGAELLVAGGPAPAELPSDPEAERLRKLAAEYGVADRVRLLGAVPHEAMPALMSGADLVLSTPVYEPFGIVPLEAMACRTPVVATAVGGQLDTVLDGRTGLLLPPDCPDDALAAAVRDLLADPDRLARYGAAGRERVLERFTWERVAEGVERVYREVLERHREQTGLYSARAPHRAARHAPFAHAAAAHRNPARHETPARPERGTDR